MLGNVLMNFILLCMNQKIKEMKKQTLKSLKLRKKVISKITNIAGGARFHTYTCNSNSVLMCPIEPDTSDPLEPIQEEPTVFQLSVCFCVSEAC